MEQALEPIGTEIPGQGTLTLPSLGNDLFIAHSLHGVPTYLMSEYRSHVCRQASHPWSNRASVVTAIWMCYRPSLRQKWRPLFPNEGTSLPGIPCERLWDSVKGLLSALCSLQLLSQESEP